MPKPPPSKPAAARAESALSRRMQAEAEADIALANDPAAVAQLYAILPLPRAPSKLEPERPAADSTEESTMPTRSAPPRHRHPRGAL